MNDMLRSPTFLVGGERQRYLLGEFKREDQQLSEDYQKAKPLCFNAAAYQRTHPTKLRLGHRDADRTLVTPMILGVADGVSQIESFGIDASVLPEELLGSCSEIAAAQLIPGASEEKYSGPVPLLREAFEETESLGSTTVVLAVMDNINTYIHGKLHPMVAVIAVGDCELLMLRRLNKRSSPLEAIFHTEMQRIDGHCQQPLQLARVDDRIDPAFDEAITIEVIEKGSAVHCISAYEGDILIMGSDGVFDNLYLDEIVEVCNEMMPPANGNFAPTSEALLELISQRLVQLCHSKTEKDDYGRKQDTPIGKGGKMDDTSVVVAEVIEFFADHHRAWAPYKPAWGWDIFSCHAAGCTAGRFDESRTEVEDDMMPAYHSQSRSTRRQRRRQDAGAADESDEEGGCLMN